MERAKEISQIIELVKAKNVLFQQYEEVTDMLLNLDPDVAESQVKDREKIGNKIQKINEEITNICTNSSCGEEIREAIINKTNWSNCPADLKPVFESGQETMAFMSRIKRKNAQIIEIATETKDSIMVKIKKQNTGVMGKSAKYYRATNPMGEQNFKVLDSKL